MSMISDDVDDDEVIYIAVTLSWLKAIKNALIPMPDGTYWKVAWLQPLVDQGAKRIMFAPINSTVVVPNMQDSEMFSRN
jgi:hypothetical protein